MGINNHGICIAVIVPFAYSVEQFAALIASIVWKISLWPCYTNKCSVLMFNMSHILNNKETTGQKRTRSASLEL